MLLGLACLGVFFYLSVKSTRLRRGLDRRLNEGTICRRACGATSLQRKAVSGLDPPTVAPFMQSVYRAHGVVRPHVERPRRASGPSRNAHKRPRQCVASSYRLDPSRRPTSCTVRRSSALADDRAERGSSATPAARRSSGAAFAPWLPVQAGLTPAGLDRRNLY
jgi:hypothetical protein